MSKQEQLHALIHALTPAEKKHIRLNINKFYPDQTNKKNVLFDAVLQSKTPNEGLEKQAYRQTGYTDAYLAADRNLLYDLVLSQLCDYNADKSAAVGMLQMLEKVQVLFDKKLFSQALSLVRRLLQQTKRFESWGLVLEALRLQQRILKIMGNITEACAVMETQEQIWQHQWRANHLTRLHYQSMELRIRLSKARNEDQLNDFQQLIQDPFLSGSQPLNGFFEQFHFWECHCNYHFVRDDKTAELAANQSLIALMDAYPHIKKDQPLNYLIIATRILAIQRNLFPDRLLELLTEYRALPDSFVKQQPEAESIVFIFSYNYELDYYISNRHWIKALDLIPEMERQMLRHENRIDDAFKMTCKYRFACTYFFNGLYPQAADALSQVLRDFSYTLRPDVYRLALLLQIILHYEWGNRKLMRHLIQTTKYQLEKTADLFQTEYLLLSYLKKLIPKSLDKEIITLQQLHTALHLLFSQDPPEKQILQVFDILAWIEGRLIVLKALKNK